MFVAAGAKEQILKRRREEFYNHFIKRLLQEAASIGLDKEQVIQMIRFGEEQKEQEEKGRGV